MGKLIINVASDDCISAQINSSPCLDDLPDPFVTEFEGVAVRVEYNTATAGWTIVLSKIDSEE